ncbi:MAG: cytochrome c oxidase subunit II [Gemmatimonadota bacterium]|nr:cytochrome c oxidase subunit II [Gemmatimonadota bacterium]
MALKIHSYEKAFLIVSAAMLVIFLGALGYAAIGMGIHLPSRADEIPPGEVMSTPPFDNPGVREVEPGQWEAVVIGRAWAFVPAEIRVPVGVPITFKVTSTDVVHGFYIENTRVNLMLLPGQVSEITYTFKEPGDHLLLCHEYCGVGHHAMYGRVIAEETPAAPATGETETADAGEMSR